MNSPRCPALWFVYILMSGKEEWVLVQLGSQHKCLEWPVWPVFPDYLFLVTMFKCIFWLPNIIVCKFLYKRSFIILTKIFHGPGLSLGSCFVFVQFQPNGFFSVAYIKKSNQVVWILSILPPMELTMYLHLSRKYYVAAVPPSVHQKHLKDKKSWKRGWVIRFVV